MCCAAWAGRKPPGHGLPEQDFFPRTLEEQLVPLIDSVVELDRPTTLDERCASISRRYQQDPLFLARFAAGSRHCPGRHAAASRSNSAYHSK